jgi:hypothetical protein
LSRGCARRSKHRNRASGSELLAAAWRQSTDKETTMTLLRLRTFSPSLFAPALKGRERSFWRQLLGAIMEGRQRKADEYVRDYLRRRRGKHPDEFRSELERRLLGQ